MKNIIILILIIVSLNCFAQTNNDSILLQQQTTKFIDSLEKNTSIKQARDFLYENISGKLFNENKFTITELYNFFLQLKYQQWLAERGKPKK